CFFVEGRRGHTRWVSDWSSDVCSSDLIVVAATEEDMWGKLAVLMGRSDWATDASLKSAEARREIEDRIATGIEAWTLTRNADQRSEERRVGKEGRTRCGRCLQREREER